ncbi:hypothetical protein PG993_008969 [Apiospora rasikravindrae]|uniref:Uncharacterized protein n=1 Tax=Apiospora rasikravindrae TaxID=990691 RepID=A0ABR1SPU3_9PEZI
MEDGFYDLQDSVAGERLEDMDNRGRRFVTPYGLDFLKFIVLNPRIRRIWKEFYGRVTLGHSLIYNEKPDRIYSFSRGGPGTFFTPAVHIWSKGSVVEYWMGSQHHQLPILDGPKDNQPREPMFEYAQSSLMDANCQRRRFELTNGALIVVDARIAFTRSKNDMLLNVFFPNELIRPPLMILRKWSQELANKVQDLQSDEVGANFQFEIGTMDE